jgi:hypothetical protein
MAQSDLGQFLRALRRGDLGGIYRTTQSPAVKNSLPFRIARFLAEGERGQQFKTRVINVLPPHFFWKTWQKADTPAEFLHRAYCRALWRERGAWHRALLLLSFLTWPLVFIVTSVWATVLNGRAIARQTGKPIPRQLAEQLVAAWRWGCLPIWYYMFELYIPAHFARGGEYLHRFETTGGIYRLLLCDDPSMKDSPLQDKALFAAKCRANDLSIPEEIEWSGGELPACDIFIKPTSGSGGSGAQSWSYGEDGFYTSLATGERLTGAGLLQSLDGGSFMVQRRLVNHKAIRGLSNGALITVRLMTVQNETGGHEATHATLRMAVGANRLVDNFHAGGIVAPVDMASGRLGPASDIGFRPDMGWRNTHPDTGALIAGLVLPLWAETVDLACRAHKAFAPRLVVGWDIAITDRGPVIVEGNRGPDVDLLERSHRLPLGNGRYGELLAHHLRSVPSAAVLIAD